MESTKIMPRHLLLLFFPIATAILGGLLFSGSFRDFTNNWGGRGISQAELYLAVSFFIGAIAFSCYCLPKYALWGLLIVIPLLDGILMIVRLGSQFSLILLFILNLICGILLWLILRYTFFGKVSHQDTDFDLFICFSFGPRNIFEDINVTFKTT